MKKSVPVESGSAFIDERIKQLGDWPGAPGLAVFQTRGHASTSPHPGLESRETWGTRPPSR